VTPILLTVMCDDKEYFVCGPGTGKARSPSMSLTPPLEFLACYSEHAVAATILFDLPIHYRGGWVWVITPANEDAAFALKLRWL